MVTVPKRSAAVALGVLTDLALGDPPTRWHPVGWFGTAMTATERRLYRTDRRAGAAHAAAGVCLGIAAARLCPSVTAATAACTAGRGLRRSADLVAGRLEARDLDGARSLLPALAGRDPSGLDAGELSRAVVESVAENTVDAIVAPVWWALVGGARGVFVHRALNTMDAMVGHRSERYLDYGWASARLDDAAAWLPARLTAALVTAVRPAAARAVVTAVREQAPAHPSPNAGVAEAAYAAALGIRLGGTNVYAGNVDHRPILGTGRCPEPGDIRRATALCRDITLALMGSLGAVAAVDRVRR
ncbi:MAG TPA: CobD/CbiB family cobalamin biosynthesis protein [Mycobacteriales bacterium]|nr:CobD/CbiB family cobalamin biosynthesis protein [Mycobacteriales bacterium]